MANDNFYGYKPKKQKPSGKEGQIYSGLEKDNTYANLGNRLDRVNPYEFRKGMDYELTSMGILRLQESTPDEREKATESVLKNLETHGGYYSALIHYETEYRNSSTKPAFKTWLKEFYEENNMKEVGQSFKNDKMEKLKEAIKSKLRRKLLFEQAATAASDDVDLDSEEDEDVTAKKATRGAKKAAKSTARFDKEIEAIKELLYGKDKGEEKATEENPMKGSLVFLKNKHLDAYKIDKDVPKYKAAIELPDVITKKLEKHVEKFGDKEKGLGNKVTLDAIKGKDIPDTIKKLEARITAIGEEEKEAIALKEKERNEIASTDMTRANHLKLLEIIRANGISLREGAEGIRTYYNIAKEAYLEGLSKGLKL